MATSWQWLERATYKLLNSLTGDGGAASAESLLVRTTALLDADIDNAAFPRAAVRQALVEHELTVIAAVCQTPEHPGRSGFRLEATVTHRGTLPVSLAPHGPFTATLTSGELVHLKARSAVSDIEALRADADSLRGVPDYYYAILGNTFYTNAPDDLTVTTVYYFAARAAAHPSELAALFDASTDLMRLPDHFASPVVYFAAAQLMSAAGAYREHAAVLAGMGATALRDALGVGSE